LKGALNMKASRYTIKRKSFPTEIKEGLLIERTVINKYRKKLYASSKSRPEYYKNRFEKLNILKRYKNISLYTYRFAWFRGLSLKERQLNLKKIITANPKFLVMLEKIHKEGVKSKYGHIISPLKNNFLFEEKLFNIYCDFFNIKP